MTDPVILSLAEAEALATGALAACRTSPANAAATARALVAAEADGQAGHGLSRVPAYAAQAKAGKVDGFAEPHLERVAASALVVDGAFGFAYPAIDLAVQALIPLAKDGGVALAAVRRSHHFGQAGAHAERLARAGLIGLVVGNSPKAMAFWGGRRAALGTNPIAFACPTPGGAPLVIDLALSVAARGKIVAAEAAGRPIPEGWAVDAEGRATSDPADALKGTLLPIGGAKGSALALMVEILAAALTGSAFGWEASSLFDDRGPPPNLGQAIIAIDPDRLSGGAFLDRMAALLAAMGEEPGVRRPGQSRLANRARAAEAGVAISAKLHAELLALAAGDGALR
jgi:(2R)-3-sulfolactate dehydrogenase (NADP+)